MLLDKSGSIGDTTGEANAYRDAAQAFVNALANTPTSLKIGSFNTAAAFSNGGSAYNLDLGADVTSANAAISSIYGSVSGGTNWDAGMQLAATAGSDLVVFITDGNPTVRNPNSNTDSSDTSGTVNQLDLAYGIASANLTKGANEKILAVGVGSGITANNLKLMSGPNNFDTNPTNPDYAAISDPAALSTFLKTLANQLCGARIHVRKLTDGEPNPTTPRSGWTMTASNATLPTTLAQNPVVTDGTQPHDSILVNNIPVAGASGIQLAETQQSGYVLAASICKTGGFTNPADGVGLSPPGDGAVADAKQRCLLHLSQ